MRVLVVGGGGFLRGHIVAELAAAGHEVVAAGRDLRVAQRRYPYARWLRSDLARFGEADWTAVVSDVGAVINCAGALQDGPAARAGAPLPAAYRRLWRLWFAFGFPAFGSVLAIIWLMVAKPSL